MIAATDLADHLTRRGMPFRQAHEIVGRIVRAAEASGRRPGRLLARGAAGVLAAVRGSRGGLQASDVVAARDVMGGTAPGQVSHNYAWRPSGSI